MVTGKREPTGVELHMTHTEAQMIEASLDATARLCSSLIATGPHGEAVPGSQLGQLPEAVIVVLRSQAKEHDILRQSIRSLRSDGPMLP